MRVPNFVTVLVVRLRMTAEGLFRSLSDTRRGIFSEGRKPQ